MIARPLTATIVAAALFAIACEQEQDDPVPTPEDLIAPVAIHDGTWNYNDALIQGTLVEQDGCLVLLAGGQRVLPAFADDRVTWDPPTHVLTVRGVEFRPGGLTSFGGSGGDGRDLPSGLNWVNGPVATCRYDAVWFVNPPSGPPSDAQRTPPPGGDAGWYAQQFGVTLEEAERRLGLQLAAGESAALLQATYPDRLAGVWLEHTGEFRLVAWYTGSDAGLDEARAIAAGAPLPVEIRTGAGHSEAELRAVQDRILPRAQELFYLVGTSVDVITNSVQLFIENRPPNAARAPELAAQLSQEFGVPITIEVGD